MVREVTLATDKRGGRPDATFKKELGNSVCENSILSVKTELEKTHTPIWGYLYYYDEKI